MQEKKSRIKLCEDIMEWLKDTKMEPKWKDRALTEFGVPCDMKANAQKRWFMHRVFIVLLLLFLFCCCCSHTHFRARSLMHSVFAWHCNSCSSSIVLCVCCCCSYRFVVVVNPGSGQQMAYEYLNKTVLVILRLFGFQHFDIKGQSVLCDERCIHFYTCLHTPSIDSKRITSTPTCALCVLHCTYCICRVGQMCVPLYVTTGTSDRWRSYWTIYLDVLCMCVCTLHV